MRKSKSHIAPLAFLLLIFFVSPMTVKAVHHHNPGQMAPSACPQGKSISANVCACPVCQFEFVTFLAFDNPEYTPFGTFTSLDFSEPIPSLKANSYTCYSLRAPPVF